MRIIVGLIAAAIVALSLPAVVHLWPLVHGTDPDWAAYTVLFRLGPLMRGVVPAVVAMVVFLALLRTRSRIWAASLSALVLFGVAAYIGWTEYARLVPNIARGWQWRQLGPYIDLFGVAGAGTSFLIGFFLPGLALITPDPPRHGEVPSPKRAKSALHGAARFLTMPEVAELFPATRSAVAAVADRTDSAMRGKDGEATSPAEPTGTIVIGERYRVDKDSVAHRPFDPKNRETWGRGGSAPLICYDPVRGSGPTHIVVVSGSGGYKTTSIVASNCLHYGHSIVVVDPDRQAYAISADARESMGQKVILVTPDDRTSGFNVLDWIDPERDDAPEHVALVASWVCNTKLNGREAQGFFSSSAEALVTGLLAYVVFDETLSHSERNLRHLRELISTPAKELVQKVESIVRSPPHPFVKLALGPFVGQYYATFSGIVANAHELTKWLTFGPYADLVSQGSSPTALIANGRTSVFLGLGVDVLGNNPGLARTLLGALLNATKMASGSLTGRVLFIVDEAARLGHMRVLEEMRDTGRKYGITLIMLYQSLGQIRAQWGGESGLSDWMQSTGCQIFGAINDQDTAERIAKKAGTYTAENTSTSRSTVARGSTGGSGVNRTTTTNLVSVPLIRPAEITQLMRADEQIVFFGSMSPIRCGRAIYFRRPEMVRIAGEDRFARVGRPATSTDAAAA